MTFDEVLVGQTVHVAGSVEPWLVVQKHAAVTRFTARVDMTTGQEVGEDVPVSPARVELSSWTDNPNAYVDPSDLTLSQ